MYRNAKKMTLEARCGGSHLSSQHSEGLRQEDCDFEPSQVTVSKKNEKKEKRLEMSLSITDLAHRSQHQKQQKDSWVEERSRNSDRKLSLLSR